MENKMKPAISAILSKMKSKKMNKGGMCYAKGGIIDLDLDPDIDGDTFEDKDWLDAYDDDEFEKKPKKDPMGFAKRFFIQRAVRRR